MLAEDLKALNDSRKEMTEKGVEEAVDQIENIGTERGQGAGRLSAGMP